MIGVFFSKKKVKIMYSTSETRGGVVTRAQRRREIIRQRFNAELTRRLQDRDAAGKKLLFDIAMSDTDLGRYLLEFVPGKKGKYWYSINEAAAAGHFHIVKSLQDRDATGRKLLFDIALSNTKIGENVMEFLPGIQGKDWWSANYAAAAGHLHLVQSLYKRGFKVDHNGIEIAAKCGRINVLKWLAEETGSLHAISWQQHINDNHKYGYCSSSSDADKYYCSSTYD